MSDGTEDAPKVSVYRYNPPPEKRWVKGQSGNPKGRRPGTGWRQKLAKEEFTKAVQLQMAGDAKKLLNKNSVAIVTEILIIALKPEPKPSQAKVKCLTACLERIVPALRVIDMAGDHEKKPNEMTDQEIMELMARMVDMAQGQGQAVQVQDKSETLDG